MHDTHAPGQYLYFDVPLEPRERDEEHPGVPCEVVSIGQRLVVVFPHTDSGDGAEIPLEVLHGRLVVRFV